MKKILIIIFAFLSFAVTAKGQDMAFQADTLDSGNIHREHVLVALNGKIVASDSLDKAMTQYIEKNRSRSVSVYRLRIFFDNHQNARNISEQVALEFSQIYPDVPVFRGYVNPYFKVTVGNFRTKSEAMKFLNQIKGQYPSIFLVRETFSTI